MSRRRHISRRVEFRRRTRTRKIAFVRRGELEVLSACSGVLVGLLLFLEKQYWDFLWSLSLARKKAEKLFRSGKEKRFSKLYNRKEERGRRAAVFAAQFEKDPETGAQQAFHDNVYSQFHKEEGRRRTIFLIKSIAVGGGTTWVKTRKAIELLSVSALVLISISIVTVLSFEARNILFEGKEIDVQSCGTLAMCLYPISSAAELTEDGEITAEIIYPPDERARYWAHDSSTQILVGWDGASEKLRDVKLSKTLCKEEVVFTFGSASRVGQRDHNRNLARNRAEALAKLIANMCLSSKSVPAVLRIATSDPLSTFSDGRQRRLAIVSVTGAAHMGADRAAILPLSLELHSNPNVAFAVPNTSDFLSVEVCFTRSADLSCSAEDWERL